MVLSDDKDNDGGDDDDDDDDEEEDDDDEEKHRFKSKSPYWFSVKICRPENNETVKRPQSHCVNGFLR